MEVFAQYLSGIENPQHRARMQEVFDWIAAKFPELAPKIAWNQPMFTHHGTFIIGFSMAKKHIAVAPERACLNRFTEEITQAGYEYSKELVRIPWDGPLDFPLLQKMIEFNILDKADCATFWRK